jgi:hypothetical protein
MPDQLQESSPNIATMDDSPDAEEIGRKLLGERFPSLHSSTIRTLAAQAEVQPISPNLNESEVSQELGKRISSLMSAQFPHLLPKRQGRGKLILVGPSTSKGRWQVSRNNDAERDPGASDEVTDQKLTTYSLRSTASPQNESTNREHEQATERVEHILAALPRRDKETILHLRSVVEVGDSLRETARKAGLHPSQVSRAYEAARRAYKTQIFARRRATPSNHQRSEPYDPRSVAQDVYMQTHDGAVIPYIGQDKRTSVGRNIILRASRRIENSSPLATEFAGRQTASPIKTTDPHNPYPSSSGCAHENRQWLRAGFADLRLTCLSCRTELKQTNPFIAADWP